MGTDGGADMPTKGLGRAGSSYVVNVESRFRSDGGAPKIETMLLGATVDALSANLPGGLRGIGCRWLLPPASRDEAKCAFSSDDER